MIIKLPGIPEGCKMAAVENINSANYTRIQGTNAVTFMHLDGQAVCGDRQVQATSEFTASGGYNTDPDSELRAHKEVAEDLTHLIGAACLGCPNRDSGNLPVPSNQ